MQIKKWRFDMNANASDTADTLQRSARDTAGDFRRRSSNVRDYANEELRAFLADVEDLLKKVANVGDADVARLRNKVSTALGDVRRNLNESAESLRERARAAAQATDGYVRERPWSAIGLAAAVGLIAGIGVTAAARR
jgi:ElaB/YqjD/DUF883 family membrane-anchored ribosome-binding protein